MLQESIDKFSSNPKQLFVIDGLGALLSAFLLGVVLVQLESFFGIPKNTLYFLAFLPCLFAAYDLYCFFNIKKNIGLCLKIIAIVNILYCCLSIALALYHFELVTYLGWIYIIGEIMIVLFIAFVELKVADRVKATTIV